MSITPSQTVGPFFRIGLIADEWRRHPGSSAAAQIEIAGTVYDAEGKPVLDAMLEIWQADAQRFIRVDTDPALGTFRFEANVPRGVRDPQGRTHAPHLTVGVFARGVLRRLHTRIYIADEPLNESDPILMLVPPQRRSTLLAKRVDEKRYDFDIRLSGQDETVFFEC
jgi:protocatechuate 3,4-dioxygenase, alpha subunit